MVSSHAVTRPTASGANYGAMKAAAVAWTRSLAHGYVDAAKRLGTPLQSAAVIYRVRSLTGLEERLAESIRGLWDHEAERFNDLVISLE